MVPCVLIAELVSYNHSEQFFNFPHLPLEILDLELETFFSVLYSTLFLLPPLKFHCVAECWDQTQDVGISCQML